MTFKSLGLSEPLLQAIAQKGYTTPSPIQAKSIPVILEGHDVLASAQTGTGKTAGFTLPILQLLSERPISKRPPIRALILTPTRELAAQIYENVKEYSQFINIRSVVIFGGVGQNPQVEKIQRGVDILIATPGRLLDLCNQRLVSLSQIECLVLDEADRMLDMGFLRDIHKILDLLPKKRQTLLFSATFSKEIKILASQLLHNPTSVEAQPENTTAERISQTMYWVDNNHKAEVVTQFIDKGKWHQVLIFTRTKHGANKFSEKLIKAGIPSAAIHGNKSQAARTKALGDFKKNQIRVLVATDIAARGLDIPLLPHVINFELPNIPEDYVHRIGRTGRAGASGEAISLVGEDERTYQIAIEKLLGESFDVKIVPGFEPTAPLTDPPKPGQGRKPNPQNKRSSGQSPKPSSPSAKKIIRKSR